MVKPVNGKIIFRTAAKTDLPRLKNMVKITDFTIGKNQLGPCLTGLFQKQGYDIKKIHVDNIAKIRLLGMNPSLEKRVENGESIDKIFSDLELSLFLTEDQNLYILGDKQNIVRIKEPLEREAAFMRSDQTPFSEKTAEEKAAIIQAVGKMASLAVRNIPEKEWDEFKTALKTDLFGITTLINVNFPEKELLSLPGFKPRAMVSRLFSYLNVTSPLEFFKEGLRLHGILQNILESRKELARRFPPEVTPQTAIDSPGETVTEIWAHNNILEAVEKILLKLAAFVLPNQETLPSEMPEEAKSKPSWEELPIIKAAAETTWETMRQIPEKEMVDFLTTLNADRDQILDEFNEIITSQYLSCYPGINPRALFIDQMFYIRSYDLPRTFQDLLRSYRILKNMIESGEFYNSILPPNTTPERDVQIQKEISALKSASEALEKILLRLASFMRPELASTIPPRPKPDKS